MIDMDSREDDIYPAEYREAQKTQAAALKAEASEHDLRLEAYSRRQRVNKDRDNPYRRAATEPCRKPRRFYSTTRTFSSSDQSRRRPRSSADTSRGEMIVAHDVRHGPKANQQITADVRIPRTTSSTLRSPAR